VNDVVRGGERRIGLWPAIAWAEGLLLLGLAGVGLAIVSTWPSCNNFLQGCAPRERSLGGDSIVWLVASAAALAGGIFMAAWTSGWPRTRVVVRGTIALAASAAALALGAIASNGLTGEYLPAIVLAVGVAGIVAIRPTSPRAVTERSVTLAIFVALALVFGSVAALVVLLALVTLPAMGAVESALGSELERA
jgi:hypothetical protein